MIVWLSVEFDVLYCSVSESGWGCDCKACMIVWQSLLSLLYCVAVSLKVGEFVGASMAILEGISKHPTLLMEHQVVVVETILPQLVSMVGSQTGKMMTATTYRKDTQVEGLGILNAITC